MTHVIMSNNSIRMVGSAAVGERNDLDVLMMWVFNRHRQCVGWRQVHDPTRDKGNVLMLYWMVPEINPNGINKFLAPLNEAETKMAVVGWLRQEEIDDELRDFDGDELHDGFEAWTDRWGHGTPTPELHSGMTEHYAMISIRKRTRQIGK